jgi:transcriptional regulator with XRE-family HTH domain
MAGKPWGVLFCTTGTAVILTTSWPATQAEKSILGYFAIFLDVSPYYWYSIFMTPSQCRAARAFLDWSQDRLAKEASVATNTVRNFERGSTQPHASVVAALRNVLGRAGIEFLGDDTVRFDPPTHPEVATDSDIRMMEKLLAELMVGESDQLDRGRAQQWADIAIGDFISASKSKPVSLSDLHNFISSRYWLRYVQ